MPCFSHLAWPRFQAAFRFLPVDLAIARYHAEREIPSDRLLVLLEFARAAIGHHDHYRYRDGLSQLHLLRGLDPWTPALERRPAYVEAEAEAVHSLRQAPAQPETWLRLATIRWILHDEPADIVAPWKMSVFTGRTHSALYAQRVELGLAHRAFLDDEALAMRLGGTRPGQELQAAGRRDAVRGSSTAARRLMRRSPVVSTASSVRAGRCLDAGSSPDRRRRPVRSDSR